MALFKMKMDKEKKENNNLEAPIITTSKKTSLFSGVQNPPRVPEPPKPSPEELEEQERIGYAVRYGEHNLLVITILREIQQELAENNRLLREALGNAKP